MWYKYCSCTYFSLQSSSNTALIIEESEFFESTRKLVLISPSIDTHGGIADATGKGLKLP